MSLVVLIFSVHLTKGQEIETRASIVKVYPFAALKDEFRIGWEKELQTGKSIELGGGFLYRTFEWSNCKECYFYLPGYFSPYAGNGVTLRVNWNNYLDSAKSLNGFYTSTGIRYKYFHFNKSEYTSNGELPYGYYFANQHALYLQAIFGRQFLFNDFLANIYAGFGTGGKLNFVQSTSNSYKLSSLKENPYTNIGSQIYIGMSFGYKYN